MTVSLRFFGAAEEVTGSCFLVESDRARLLVECGMHQGPPERERLNRAPFPFTLKGLDAVVLTHAHLDHSGLLPKLVAAGWRGPIYCTPASRRLLRILLMDAAYLEQRDVEWENLHRRRAGRGPVEPIYTFDDVRRTLRLCRTLPYHQREEIARGVQLTYYDAGHILGSAHAALSLRDGGDRHRLFFSGDIGNPDTLLMTDSEPPEAADLVVMEGTYGDRDHQPMAATLEEFAAILQQAWKERGNVLIPAFALGRTQEILYHLLLLRRQGRLPQHHIFLDSPMAIEVTELYLDSLEALDQADLAAITDNGRLSLDQLLAFVHPVRTPEESMGLNRIDGGAIIIAGSGMCDGGRIRHHFKHRLWRENTHVVMVGFQAEGSLGRRLVNGERRIQLFGHEILVKARIHTLGGYSAHAGRGELLRWAASVHGRPRFLLVHGEPEALESLRDGLREHHGIGGEIPRYGERVTL